MLRNLLVSTGFGVIFHTLKEVMHFPFYFSTIFKSYKLWDLSPHGLKGTDILMFEI